MLFIRLLVFALFGHHESIVHHFHNYFIRRRFFAFKHHAISSAPSDRENIIFTYRIIPIDLCQKFCLNEDLKVKACTSYFNKRINDPLERAQDWDKDRIYKEVEKKDANLRDSNTQTYSPS